MNDNMLLLFLAILWHHSLKCGSPLISVVILYRVSSSSCPMIMNFFFYLSLFLFSPLWLNIRFQVFQDFDSSLVTLSFRCEARILFISPTSISLSFTFIAPIVDMFFLFFYLFLRHSRPSWTVRLHCHLRFLFCIFMSKSYSWSLNAHLFNRPGFSPGEQPF